MLPMNHILALMIYLSPPLKLDWVYALFELLE